ncbi:MAG: protein kinase [Polyangiaceae bacterium]
MDERADALAPGAVFHGRYRIVRPIKTGGMGEVYEVVDLRTNTPRALKVMLAATLESPEQRARFEQEAQVTGAIDSEHIVRISDAGVDADRPFLVMELLRGEELQALLDRSKVLPPGEVILYLTQVARALEKTHAQTIIHRDLKPENLFVARRDDGSPCVKILDFGIAKVATAAAAKKTRSVGTPLFMAPEQVLGEGSIQPSADLYALAHVAYCLLAGEPYWTEDAEAHDSIVPMLKRVLGGALEAPSARAMRRKRVTLPAGFDAWFARAAAVDPAARFPSATQQIEALRAALLSSSGPVSGALDRAPFTGAPTSREDFARSNMPATRPATSVMTPQASAYAQSIDTTVRNPATQRSAGTFAGATSDRGAPTERSASGFGPTVALGPASGFGAPASQTYGAVPASTGDVAAHRGQALAPGAPAQRSRTPLVVVGVVGVLVAAGAAVAITIAVTASKTTATASASVSKPPSSVSAAPTPGPSLTSVSVTPPSPSGFPPNFAITCPPGSTCGDVKVANFSAAPVEDLLAQASVFARSLDPSSKLAQFSIAKVWPTATVDLAKDEAVTALFTLSRGTMTSVSSVRNLLIATPLANSIGDAAASEPCSYKTALGVALTNAGGADLMQASYVGVGMKPTWMFSLPKGVVSVDAATCALAPMY